MDLVLLKFLSNSSVIHKLLYHLVYGIGLYSTRLVLLRTGIQPRIILGSNRCGP